MNEIDINRSEIRKQAEKESAIADMKQHSDKLIQGLEGNTENHHKRGIWELVQNARDLSINSAINVVMDKANFAFTHNGKPFTSKTLLSLIKQVSSKSPDKRLGDLEQKGEELEVGQYGTGFITTHAFGRKFLLNGSMEIGTDTYIDLTDFEVDRTASNSEKLAEKLVSQQNAMFALIDNGTANNTKRNTTFTYIFDGEREFNNAFLAITKFTEYYVPLILALNERVTSISIESKIENVRTEFTRLERLVSDGLIVNCIDINSEVKKIYSIRSDEDDIEIILPLATPVNAVDWHDSMSRLFLFFPLIGTENWGMNFIIHSGRFAPTEPRDGLHLMSDNPATLQKEKWNQEIISKASKLIFTYLKENALKINDPIHFANISFSTSTTNTHLNSYFQSLKTVWLDEFKTFSLVDTTSGRLTPTTSAFLSVGLSDSGEYFDSVYEIVEQFWSNIPNKEISKKWTSIINTWADEAISVITMDDVLKKIEESATLEKFNKDILKKFYEYVNFSGNVALFDTYKLLPNIKNDFIKKKELNSSVTIPEAFIEIADILIPNIPKTFLKDDFSLGLQYSKFTRHQLSKEFNSKFSELTSKTGDGKHLDRSLITSIIKLCSIYPSSSNKGVRGDLMPLICHFYSLTYTEIQIPNDGEDAIDHFSPLKFLVRVFLNDIYARSCVEVGWCEQNISFINDVLRLLFQNKDFEEMIKTFQIFPNQNFKFEAQAKLQKEESMPEDLKLLYHDILKKPIKDFLVHNDSAQFLNHDNKKTGVELAVEIQAFFDSQGIIEQINEHPSKKVIFEIIKRFKDEDETWSKLFGVLAEKKEIIMMARITKADMKENMFSILEVEDSRKLALLGDLAKNADMERIIALGHRTFQEEQENDSDFQFKHKIGIHIESLLRKQIEDSVKGNSLKVEPLQGGQDIVVKQDGDIIYYLEVKSRWSKQYSITMSNLQMKTAVSKKDMYSLCCVDLVNYHPEDGNRHYPEDLNMVVERIKVLPDIGYKIQPLAAAWLDIVEQENTVSLTGDYRLIVPQNIVSSGMSLNELANIIIGKIK